MRRIVTHLVMCLTLALNGIVAPWAMAQMSHGEHATGTVSSGHHGSHHDVRLAGGTKAHASHDDPALKAVGLPTIRGQNGMDDSDACCDGMTCQCGCVLPPVLVFARLEINPTLIDHAAFTPAVVHLVERRDSPPLRPPLA